MTKRLRIFGTICALALMVSAGQVQAREVVPALAGLTGGTSGKLDAIAVSTASGVSTPGSLAITRDASGGRIYLHELVTSGGVESSPYIITPDDAGAGATRWYCIADFDSGTSNVYSALAAIITAHTVAGAFSGTSDFATDSAVSQFVHGQLASYLAAGAVSGTSLAQTYALQSVLTAQTGGSPWAKASDLTAQTGGSPGRNRRT